MKKIIFAFMAVLVLASCSKSGVKEYQVEEVPFSGSMMDMEPLSKYDEPAAEVFSVVPGTCKIEYYPVEGASTLNEMKITMKCRLNKPVELTDYAYERFDATRSMPIPQLLKENTSLISVSIVPLDADGKSLKDDLNSFMIFGKYVQDNSEEYENNQMDGRMEWYDFITSPAGTEKELSMYTTVGGQKFVDALENVTSFAICFSLDSFTENSSGDLWKFK